MGKKLDYEFIKEQFENRGWVLLENSYENAHIQMRCLCPEKHETTITWMSFRIGSECKYCLGLVKHSYEEVKKMFEDAGCELLENDYKHNEYSMSYRCSCGNESKTSYSSFKNGSRCSDCGDKKIAESLRRDYEEIKKCFTDHGCILLDKKYKNNRTKMKFICKCGREDEINFNNFKKSHNCKQCGVDKRSGPNCSNWNPDREEIKLSKRYRKRCGNILKRALDFMGQHKTDNTYKLLGYTSKQLRDHIENHPDHPGKHEEIHIDHIFPVKAFLDNKIFDLKLINCLENLRPLKAFDNLSKADNYNETEFLEWVAKKQQEQQEYFFF